jgi:GAF domain-containing protein
MTDSDRLLAALRELSNLLLSDETMRSSLQRVAFLSVRAIEVCDAAGVSVVSDGGVTTAASSDNRVEAVDEIQYRTGQGPCLQAITDGRIFRLDSMDEETRWPEFTAVAAECGVRGCLALPLIEDGETFGALNLYSFQARPFDVGDEDAAVALAAQASGPLSNMRRYVNLQRIASRLSRTGNSAVPMAAGVLMERNCCSHIEAMRLLTRIAEEEGHDLEGAALAIVRSVTSPIQLRGVGAS